MKLKTGIKNLITFFLIAIICVCGYRIYEKLNDYKKADDLYANLRTEKEANLDKNNSNSGTANTIDLSSINKDFVCWINIENTNIDYPVVQGKDNSYYLHRDIYGNYLYAGTTFLDYRDYYDDSKNLIIYGHNMKNTTMFSQLEKAIVLRVVDNKWMEHLDNMDMLREGIGLRAYGQKNPLVEYKFEAFDMFQNMIAAIQDETIMALYKIRAQLIQEIEEPVDHLEGAQSHHEDVLEPQNID